MKGTLGVVFATLLLVSNAPPLAAQPAAARIANRETIEFQVSRDERAAAIAYRVEVFLSGSDTSIAVPLMIRDLHATRTDDGQPIRIDFKSAMDGVPDGEYIATIRVVRANGVSPRSQPTAPFVIVSNGLAPPAPSAASAAAAASAPDPTDEEKRRERFWTKVSGIAVGAAVILLPFVIR